MFLRFLLSRLLLGLLPLAITSTVYLYLYPVFSGCAHPLPTTNNASHPSAFLHTLKQHLTPSNSPDSAIFRLLVLADPQLEGDTSLPRPENELPNRLRKHYADTLASLSTAPFPYFLDDEVQDTVRAAFQALVKEDLPRAFAGARKRLDLLGNDYYLAHVYRTLHWWTRPTHVTVLGDLIGSQWVSDGEFARRGGRYWRRVFAGGKRVDDDITRTGGKQYVAGSQKGEGEVMEDLPSPPEWENRIINIAGNHDVGYSGDASEHRIKRFEEVFGRANWDIRFQHPEVKVKAEGGEEKEVTPTLHLINLNSLTLDGPPNTPEIQSHGYAYINDLISHRSYPVEDKSTFTLLLTHLPLHKPEGVCIDGPYFTYFDNDDDAEKMRYKEGGLREQNHLGEFVSVNGVLQGIFGMNGNGNGGGYGRNGLILTGHDHEGCDVVHSIHPSPEPPATGDSETEPQEPHKPWTWNATRYTKPNSSIPQSEPSIREITLRSMMGEYGGNAGLLSLWFDTTAAEWKYAVQMCPAGVQHVWWAVHVVDLVTVIVGVLYMLVCVDFRSSRRDTRVKGDKKTR